MRRHMQKILPNQKISKNILQCLYFQYTASRYGDDKFILDFRKNVFIMYYVIYIHVIKNHDCRLLPGFSKRHDLRLSCSRESPAKIFCSYCGLHWHFAKDADVTECIFDLISPARRSCFHSWSATIAERFYDDRSIYIVDGYREPQWVAAVIRRNIAGKGCCPFSP